MTVYDRIQDLINNEAFAEGIFEAKTPDELMKVFAEYKIELEDITKEEAFDSIQKIKSGELAEDELDDVSGGGIATAALWLGMRTWPFVPGGAVIMGAAAVAAVAYYAYRRYKKR